MSKGNTTRKKKTAFDYDRILGITRNNPIQFAPHRISDLNGLMYAVTTDSSGEREPFVEGCMKLSEEQMETLYSEVRQRSKEYDDLQGRHRADIRALKDRLSGLWHAGHTMVRPGGIHVVSEDPLLFRATLFNGDEMPVFTQAGTAEQLAETVRTWGDTHEEFGPGITYTELADEGTCPKCPVCGSQWQLLNSTPVLHCCRCDTNWVEFTKKVLGTMDCVNPGDYTAETMDTVAEEYLGAKYAPVNPVAVEKVLSILERLDGNKVVTLSYGGPAGVEDHSENFIMSDGEMDLRRHFEECLDFALCKSRMKNDRYTGNNPEKDRTVCIHIHVPDCADVDMDEFCDTINTEDSLPCTYYAILVGAGRISGIPADMLADAIGEELAGVIKPRNLAEIFPELNEFNPIVPEADTGKPGFRMIVANPMIN